MTDQEYNFCLTYHFYQQNKNKNGHDYEYTKILYGAYGQGVSFTLPAIYFKRLYNRLKDEALERMEEDIMYCEIRCQLEKKKKENANSKEII